MGISGFLSHKFTTLPENLRKARMSDPPELFIKKTLVSSFYISLGLLFIIFLFIAKTIPPIKLMLVLTLSFPIIQIVMFFYFFQIPKIRIQKLNMEVNKEIIFASRFLVVELESGVTLYEAIKNTAKNYTYTGVYLNEIIAKINIGTSIEVAITETVDICASESLITILWQISNSLKTGSNISSPLRTVTDTLIKEQQIQVNEYAKKLNPLAMFYMMIAIIMPSLGVTMFTIISMFVGLKLNLTILLIIAFLNGFVQFMFVAIINSIRPPVEL